MTSSENKAKTIRQGMSSSLYDMPLHIDWSLTRGCNYRCSYCNLGKLRENKRDWLDLDTNKQILANLLQLNRVKYIFGLTGGEPTFYPHFVDLIEYMAYSYKDKLALVYIVTNGSNKHKIYEPLKSIAKRIPFLLYISIHTDHIQVHDIEYLVDLSDSIPVIFSLMFNPARISFVKEIYQILCEKRLNHSFGMNISTIRELNNENIIDRRYTRDDLIWQEQANAEFIKIANQSSQRFILPRYLDHVNQHIYLNNGEYKYEVLWRSEEFIKADKFNLKDKYCVLGTHAMHITPDGYAGGSTCKMSKFTKRPIYEESPYCDPEFLRIVKCQVDKCGCPSDDYLQKFQCYQEAECFLKHFKSKQDMLTRQYHESFLCKSLLKYLGNILHTCNNLVAGAVDKDWYYTKYPDVAQSGMDAGLHYCKYGYKENRNPTPWFDTAYYLSLHPDLGDVNPFLHFLTRGIDEWHKPNPDWF